MREAYMADYCTYGEPLYCNSVKLDSVVWEKMEGMIYKIWELRLFEYWFLAPHVKSNLLKKRMMMAEDAGYHTAGLDVTLLENSSENNITENDSAQ